MRLPFFKKSKSIPYLPIKAGFCDWCRSLDLIYKPADYYGILPHHNCGIWVCEAHKEYDIIQDLTPLADLDATWLEKVMGLTNVGKANGVTFGYTPALHINQES